MRPAADESDVLLLANGDRAAGDVVRLDETGITLETDLGETTVTFERLRSAALNPGDDRGGPPVLKARLFLADGAQIDADALTWTPKEVKARLFGRTEHAIPADQLLRIEVSGGRWQWLSTLDPISVEQTPFLSLTWPWQRDRNVRGGPVQIRGTQYDRGIGVRSQCRLVYFLGGEYKSLFSHYGIDDRAGPLADVDVQVRVDGQTRFDKLHVTRSADRTPGQPIRVDGAGADQLELIVTFGARGDVQDRFNWAGAALIR